MATSDSARAGLQSRLGHTFRDVRLLELALTHPSWQADGSGATTSNQRLEFLGDAVLQLVLTEALYGKYPDEREGGLSRRRALLVNGSLLAALAREAGISGSLRLSAGEESSGGRDRESTLEDALEAVIGAVYLDAGLESARATVLKLYGDLESRLAAGATDDNPKGRLQELVQPVHGNQALRYELMRTEGEDHARTFEVTVFLLDRPLGAGRGSSKKSAEEAAARAALAALQTES